jgi:hypothetical protein
MTALDDNHNELTLDQREDFDAATERAWIAALVSRLEVSDACDVARIARHWRKLLPASCSPDPSALSANQLEQIEYRWSAWMAADLLRLQASDLHPAPSRPLVVVRLVVLFVRRTVRTFHSARQTTGDGDGAAAALRLVSTLSRPASLQGCRAFSLSAVCS